jgi:hypothetical protein
MVDRNRDHGDVPKSADRVHRKVSARLLDTTTRTSASTFSITSFPKRR